MDVKRSSLSDTAKPLTANFSVKLRPPRHADQHLTASAYGNALKGC